MHVLTVFGNGEGLFFFYVLLHDYVIDRNRMQWNALISGYPVAESIATNRDKGVHKTH